MSAMNPNAQHGIDRNEDLDPNLISRDVRPLRFRFRDFVAANGGFMLVMLGLIITLWPFLFELMLADLLCGAGVLFWLYARRRVETFPFRTPIDYTGRKKNSGNGLLYLGYDRGTNGALWFSDDDARTHMLVFGSTGSGKTRFLLGVFYQAMMFGSGAIYVDGKGDNSVWWLAYSLCRRLGREDDLLVMNYLTGSGGTETNRITNSNNPFAYGNAEQLRSLVVGLMRESGPGDAMWKGRATAMLGGLLKALTTLRDRGEIELDIAAIRGHLPLDKIVSLALRKELPESALKPLQGYLAELPGYNEHDAMSGQLQQKCYEQHGYLSMQLTEVMADLTDTYGHIFGYRRGEIDFKDVVFNRRLLFVMLPALEKDPDALAGLGKLVVAGVRAALAPALGNEVSGSRREAVEQKPSNSKVPFIIILDEYGYYSVKGFAVVAAQARSLGVSVCFAGQDYPSFKKSSQEEAASVLANTNIKVFMKLEDPKETFEVAQQRGGKATVAEVHSYRGQASGLYRDEREARMTQRERINLRDLANQKPGQAHVINGDEISRAQLFYADPYEVPEVKLNEFLMVENPPKHTIDQINGTFRRFQSLVQKGNAHSLLEKDEAHEAGVLSLHDPGLETLFSDLRLVGERGIEGHEAAVVAIGIQEVREQIEDYEAEQAVASRRPASGRQGARKQAAPQRPESTPSPRAQAPRGAPAEQREPSRPAPPPAQTPTPTHPDRRLAILEEDAPTETARDEARARAQDFEEMLGEVIAGAAEKARGEPLTVAERKAHMPRERLSRTAERRGLGAEDAKRDVSRSIEMINERLTYPSGEPPERLPEDEISRTLETLLKRVDEQRKF